MPGQEFQNPERAGLLFSVACLGQERGKILCSDLGKVGEVDLMDKI